MQRGKHAEMVCMLLHTWHTPVRILEVRWYVCMYALRVNLIPPPPSPLSLHGISFLTGFSRCHTRS